MPKRAFVSQHGTRYAQFHSEGHRTLDDFSLCIDMYINVYILCIVLLWDRLISCLVFPEFFCWSHYGGKQVGSAGQQTQVKNPYY